MNAERPADASAGTVHLREARTSDVTAIASVFLTCWRTSYRGVLPPRVLELYDEEASQRLWGRLLPSGAADGTVLVAERPPGTIVGVVRLGRDRDRPSCGHVFSLYVHPSAQGSGVGRALLDAAGSRFAAAGLREATLWVFAANDAARAFYGRLGWSPDGATRVEPAYGEPEVRLTQRIAAAPDGPS